MLDYNLHLDRVAQVGLVGAIPSGGIAIRNLLPRLDQPYGRRQTPRKSP